MTNGGQRFRERPAGEEEQRLSNFRYERTLVNMVGDNVVLYRFGSDTVDLSRLSDSEVRGWLAEELRKPNPEVSVFQTGSEGKEMQLSNEFLRNRVADRLENPAQDWSEGVTLTLAGPIEVEAVPAEIERARWVTYESRHEANGTYFSMRINMNALTNEERGKLAGLQYASPREWEEFANTLGDRARDKQMVIGRG